MNTKRKRLRRALKVIVVLVVVVVIAFLVYFPGRQTPMALQLATGISISSLQVRVDDLEAKAINGEPITEEEKRFLRDLYACFAKGGRLTITLRQSSAMMRRYLSGTGEDLETAPRIFLGSKPVVEQMNALKQQIARDLRQRGDMDEVYTCETFYMGDPAFFDSFVGLYFGHLTVRPRPAANNTVVLAWRAEVPWEWPSYESLYEKYGDYHAQNFALPNARSLLVGREHCLRLDDGLGGHLATIGLAKSFLVYSQWEQEVDLLKLLPPEERIAPEY